MTSEPNQQLLARAVQEYADSAMAGKIVAPGDFVQRYPEIAEDLHAPIASMYRLAQVNATTATRQAAGNFKWYVAGILILLTLALAICKIWRLAPIITLTPLRVAKYSPQGEAKLTSAITIVFDRAIVPTSLDQQGAGVSMVIVEPIFPHTQRWINARTLKIEPVIQLPKARQFQVKLNPTLQAVDGSRLARPFSFRFHTPGLHLEMVSREQIKPDGEVTLCLEFDDQVHPEKLRRNLKILDNTGRYLNFTCCDDQPDKRLSVRSKIGLKVQELNLCLAAELSGESGELPLGQVVKKRIRVHIPTLQLERINACSPATGDPYLYLAFSDPVTPRLMVPSAITVKPPVRFRITPDYKGLRLQGGFTSGQNYQIRLAGSITSKNGWKIGRSLVRQVRFPQRESLLRLADPGQILSLRGNKILMVETVNLATLEVVLYRIYSGNLIHLFRRGVYEYQVRQLGDPVAKRRLDIAPNRDCLNRTAISLPKLVKPNSAIGPYLLCLRGITHQGETYDRDSRFLLVSDLSITVKQIPGGEVLCWVTSLADGMPVPGARVTLWSAKNHKLAQTATDAWGVAHLHFPDSDQQVPFMVQASKGQDLSFIKLGSGAWNVESFACTGKPTCRHEYQAFIYSDRGAYRPGEQVHLAALVRDRRRQVPPSFPLRWSIHRNDGVEVHSALVASGQDGNCEITWATLPDIRTGVYRAQLRLPGAKKQLASYRFHVEDFVPDRFHLKLAGDRSSYRSGEQAQLTFSASHLHGAPAGGRRLQVRVYLGEQPFRVTSYPQYVFGDETRKFKDFPLLKSEKTLDAAGQTRLTIKVPKVKASSGLEMVVEATLHEHGGRSTTRRQKFTVHNGPGYLGLCGNFEQAPRPGRTVEFSVVAIDPEQKFLSLPQVQVRVVRYGWVWNVSGDGDDARYRYIRQEQVKEQNSLSLTVGQGKYRFTPRQYGEYRIFVSDPTGAMTSSLAFSTWGGTAARQQGGEEYLQLQCDRRDYPVGATAKINIRSPISGMALVCLERERVFAWEVVPVINGKAEVSFAVTPEYLPNVYCTATVVRPVTWQKERQPHRVYGICPMLVQTGPRRLEVTIDAAAETLPSSTVDVAIAVAQGEKKVAGALVTLAAVDEGVCQVTDFRTPDPYTFFYGKESLQNRSFDSYHQLLPESPAGDDNRRAPVSSQPKRARRFRTLAIWHSGLRTDADGRVRLRLVLPKYLGQVRLMAIASYQDCFGSRQQALRVTSPAILEVAAPRFAAWGDQFTVSASIINHTGQAAQAHLQVESGPELTLVGPTSQSVQIAANCEGRLTFLWKCLSGEQTQLRLHGTLGDHRLEETIDLPLRPAAPRIERYGYGTIAAGKDAVIRFVAPEVGDDDRVMLTLTTRPQMHLSSRLRYLLRYPHGCVEQTTSRAFPLLHIGQLLDLARDPKPGEPARAAEYVQAAIAQLASMQTSSGGLAMWPGGFNPYRWGSCYAGHFLEEARQAGYAVSPTLRSELLAYLKTLVHIDGNTRERRGLRAYACYVLALAGQIKYPDIAYLAEKTAPASADERCFLVATFAALGKRHLARQLLNRPSIKQKLQSGSNLNSPVRDDAILLATLIAIDPGSDQVRRLVDSLTASCRDGYWHNTQESAWALLALGKYLAGFGNSTARQLCARVKINGKEERTLTDGEQAHLHLPRSEKLAVQIANSGTGPLFYRWMVRELLTSAHTSDGSENSKETKDKPARLQVKETSEHPILTLRLNSNQSPLQTAVRFFDSEGKPLPAPGTIRQGELVWVKIELEGRLGYQNVAVQSLLPTGFEAENPRLANTARWKNSAGAGSRLKPDYIDIHDDRIEFFVDLPDSNRYYLYYGMRAVTPGVFHWPAVRAWCMYVPQIVAYSHDGQIVVRQP